LNDLGEAEAASSRSSFWGSMSKPMVEAITEDKKQYKHEKKTNKTEKTNKHAGKTEKTPEDDDAAPSATEV